MTISLKPAVFLVLLSLFAGGLARAGNVGVHSDTALVPTRVLAGLDGPLLRISGGDEMPPKPEDVRRADLALVLAATNPKACAVRELVVHAPISLAGAGALLAPCFASLETLNVRSSAFDDEAARLLATASFARTLRVLGIGRGVSASALGGLLRATPMIEKLTVHDPATPELASAVVLGACTKLRSVAFGCYGKITPEALDVSLGRLGAAKTLPALEELSFCSAKPGPATVDVLLRSGLATRLRVLAGVVIHDVAQAVDLGTRAPNVRVVDFATPEARSAWSLTRAPLLVKNGVLPADLTIAAGSDTRALAGVEIVEGKLDILGPADLSGLRNLSEVKGPVSISGPVTDLSALAHLRRIGGSLVIDTTELVGLGDLAALEAVGGDLQILRNERLLSTRGLSSLRTVGEDLVLPAHIAGNPRLSEVSFPALVSVGEELCIATGPAFLRDRDGSWHIDGPESTHVRVVKFRRFSNLTSASRCTIDPDDSDLIGARPYLFPALKVSATVVPEG